MDGPGFRIDITFYHIIFSRRLMGIPYVNAPGEAEASCAALVKSGKVFATASEDMDSLTFGSKVVLRHMTASGEFMLYLLVTYLRLCKSICPWFIVLNT